MNSWALAAERHGLRSRSNGFESANYMANGTYNSDDLAMLARVLEEALAAAIDGGAITDAEKQELSASLGKVIMDTFTAGEIDPEVLKQAALDSVGGR
jgi:hypothetical protein